MARRYKHWTEADEDTLHESVAPLTDEERKWVSRFAALMAAMPKRCLLVESCDNLLLVDRMRARDVDLWDGRARRNGVVLADINSALCKVTGVSG